MGVAHKPDDRLGPGTIAAMRTVAFRCAWPGKKEIMVGNFQISKDAGHDQMTAEAAKLIAAFTVEHLPDGCPAPEIIAIEPGALRWIPDDEGWRRR